jgi:hypothetical protein
LGLGWGGGDHVTGAAIWLLLVQTLLIGFRVSLFWCGILIVYLVLRNLSDKKPIKDAFLDPLEAGQERAMALSGLAGVSEVIVEREVVNPGETAPSEKPTANPEPNEVSGTEPAESEHGLDQ